MKWQYYTLAGLILILMAAVGVESVSAGLGLSPPYIRSDQLTRESVFEQRIMLTRSSPDQEMEAEIEVNLPRAEDWITIRARKWEIEEDREEDWAEFESGDRIKLPADRQLVPVVFRVEVPSDAEYDNYEGNVRFQVNEVGGDDIEEGSVSIRLGAQANVGLEVTDKVIEEFEIRAVSIPEFNEARQVWWLEYPGKMNIEMSLFNTGNVPIAPTRVIADIYDVRGEEFLERAEHTNRIDRIEPFDHGDVTAELPVTLPADNYRVHYRIYNGDEVVRSGEHSIRIRREGTIAGDTGYGFLGLSRWHQFTIVGPIVIALTLILFAIFNFSATSRQLVGRTAHKLLLLVSGLVRLITSKPRQAWVRIRKR